MNYVIYEDKARYDSWFKIILGLPIIFILAATYIGSKEPESIIYLAGAALMMAVIFWLVMPRKFFIMDDKLQIKMGGPFSMKIKYSNIKIAREMNFKETNFGMNFATSSKTPIEIIVKKGINLNFSPENRDLFLLNLNEAIKKWQIHNQPK